MWISFSVSPSRSRETGIPVQRADDLGDVVLVDLLLDHRLALGLGALLELALELRQLAVADLGHALELAVPLGPLGLHAQLVDPPLDLADAVERLLLAVEQRGGNAIERGTVHAEQPQRFGVRLIGEPGLLGVAQALRLLGQPVIVGADRARGDRVAHPPLKHHRPAIGRPLQVAGGAVRDPPEDELLGRASRESHNHPVAQLVLGLEVALLLRQVEDIAECRPARDDRRLLRLVADEMRDERVTAFVVGEDPLLLVRDDPALLQAGDDALERIVEIDHRESHTPRRPAWIAASLQMFARSAPVNPAVWRAIASRSTVSSSGLPRVCTARIETRPFRSGAERGSGGRSDPGAAAPGRDPAAGSRRPSRRPGRAARSRRARRAAGSASGPARG